MSFRPERTAIVGATGPTGYWLGRTLADRGLVVRAISRRREVLDDLFGDLGVEVAEADALDPEGLRRAIEDCDLVVDAIGLPPERMEDHPRTARIVIDLARERGARCLQVSSWWSFLPHRGEVVSETHPRTGGHRWFRLRREAEDAMLDGGAAVVHLPDFFGPRVHTSFVQMPLREAAAGRPMSWLGRGDVEREAAFVPDAMRTVADLLEREEAYGDDWGVPGNGTLSGRELARLASAHLDRPVRLRAAPAWLLRVLALLPGDLRTIRPLIPHYVRPVRYDSSKLEGLLGPQERTPLDEAVATTLDWIASASG